MVSYIITKSVSALRLVNQLWFIVPVNSWKNRASSEFLYKGKDHKFIGIISHFIGIINHSGCWKNTRRIRKTLAARDLRILFVFYQHPA